MFSEEFGVEADISWFVDTVNISKGCSNGEVRANLCKIAVYIPNIFRLGVQRIVIDASVIDT